MKHLKISNNDVIERKSFETESSKNLINSETTTQLQQ